MKFSVVLLSLILSLSSSFAKGGCGGGMFKEAERLEKLASIAKKEGKTTKQKALLRMAELQRLAAVNGHNSIDWKEYNKLKKSVFPAQTKASK